MHFSLYIMSGNNNYIPTIYVVAREAGVARVTVDRVIYKRGGMAKATIKTYEILETFFNELWSWRTFLILSQQ